MTSTKETTDQAAIIQNTDKLRKVIEKCIDICKDASEMVESIETIEKQDEHDGEESNEKKTDTVEEEDEAFEERWAEFETLLHEEFLSLMAIQKLKTFWNKHAKRNHFLIIILIVTLSMTLNAWHQRTSCTFTNYSLAIYLD